MNFVEQVADFLWDEQGYYPDETMGGFTKEQFKEQLSEKLEPMEVRFFSLPLDGGDGSASVALFKTREGAERRGEYELDTYGQGWDDVSPERLVVDHNGKIVSQLEYTHCEEEEDELNGEYKEIYYYEEDE